MPEIWTSRCDAGGAGRFGDGARAVGMDRLIASGGRAGTGMPAALTTASLPATAQCDRVRHAQVGLHQDDLADIAERFARGSASPMRRTATRTMIALARQGLDDGAADEAAAAKNGDLRDGHGCCL